MAPGPSKQFDPDNAVRRATRLFLARGYAATAMTELQEAMGIGRKSLYDTFGSKRGLYIRALEQYADASALQLQQELRRDGSPLAHLRRVLNAIGRQHSENGSCGCLLGITMAEFSTDDPEMAALVRGHLRRVEDAFVEALERARDAGEIDPSPAPRDHARLLLGALQGLALIGRITDEPALPRSIAKAAIATLGDDHT